MDPTVIRGPQSSHLSYQTFISLLNYWSVYTLFWWALYFKMLKPSVAKEFCLFNNYSPLWAWFVFISTCSQCVMITLLVGRHLNSSYIFASSLPLSLPSWLDSPSPPLLSMFLSLPPLSSPSSSWITSHFRKIYLPAFYYLTFILLFLFWISCMKETDILWGFFVAS